MTNYIKYFRETWIIIPNSEAVDSHTHVVPDEEVGPEDAWWAEAKLEDLLHAVDEALVTA